MKIIPISGEIGWDVYPQQIRQALEDANGEDVTLEISSPGGYVYDGLEIFNLIRGYKGHTTAKIIGMAASMASYIPLAADKVVAESNAIYMIHNARAYTGGDQNAHRKVADILDGMSRMLGAEYVQKTGKSAKDIAKWMDAETYFMGGQAILEAGFIDEVIKVGDELDQSALDDLGIKAMEKFESLDKKLRSEPEKFENIDKIAAILQPAANTEPRKPDAPVITNPKQEDNMNLDEYLAQNPEAKAEFDKRLEAAKVKPAHEQVEKPKLTDEQTEKVAAILASDAYGASMKGIGTKVLTGKRSFEAFEDLLSVVDEVKAKAAVDEAVEEQPESTPAAEPEQNDEAKEQAKIKADANELGKRIKGEV